MKIQKGIERNIVIGLLVSDEFIAKIRPIYDSKYMLSSVPKKVAAWCIAYYDKYGHSPKRDIEQIFIEKIKKERISEDDAERIELFLQRMSDEFDREQFNHKYLADQTEAYFRERKLEEHKEEIERLLKNGEAEEADRLAAEYSAPTIESAGDIIDLSNEEELEKAVADAFKDAQKPLFTYPGAYGEMINEHLVRSGFVAFFAPEKRGKTFNFLDIGTRAAKQGCNVAFFQAGDMTKSQQIRRFAINRARKSDKEKYCGKQWIPVKDCIHNQLDTCSKKIRESPFGVFDENDYENPRKEITKLDLIQAAKEYPDYSPCYNCEQFKNNSWGTPWLVQKDLGSALTEEEAQRVLKDFFVKKKKRFKLATYANRTLTVQEIERRLKEWEKDGFLVDVIIIDYADLLVGSPKDVRQMQNEVWMDLRGLSQKQHALLITASQTDANSYKQDTIKLSNFSEDKRKFGHATAIFGLNQDAKGREKEIGMLRVNELSLREGEISTLGQVTLLQSLKQGAPFLTSFW